MNSRVAKMLYEVAKRRIAAREPFKTEQILTRNRIEYPNLKRLWARTPAKDKPALRRELQRKP